MLNRKNRSFVENGTVFYVYTPRWTSSSAGIKALHILCHSLNEAGFESFLVLSDSPRKHASTSSTLFTPVLTPDLLLSHRNSRRKVIAIYSETVPGNPLNANNVIRYLMNYAGLLGGQKKFDKNEYLIFYSSNIESDYYGLTNDLIASRVLFLPAVDPDDFKFKLDEREDFYLLYAGKYRAFVGAPPTFKGRKIVELKRHGKQAQSREELIKLLSRCRAVISMENSSIISEAVLSGAPGLFFPNEFLHEAIAEQELGWGGTGWGVSEDEEAKARSSLIEGRNSYLYQVSIFPNRLTEIISNADRNFEKLDMEESIRIPTNFSFFSIHRVRMSIQIISKLGLITWVKVVKNFLLRRLSGRF